MNCLIVEIKAHCKDQTKIREYLKANNAKYQGTDHQIDTYFKVSNGRLKLREGNIENNLIHYNRSNKEGPKQSKVQLYKCEPNSSLKDILTKSLGTIVTVDKQREIYFIKNVKFHIDTVKGLGTFMEIEAIDKYGKLNRNQLDEQCNHYLKELDIKEQDLISNSYSDLLILNQP